MDRMPVLTMIKKLHRPVFTTREAAISSKNTLSNTIQILNHLEKQGVILKICRGIWKLDIGNERVSQYSIIQFLLPQSRAYVSFLSALHLYGIIEQIPQAISLASITHTKIIRTKLGVFYIHRIAPAFFKGFNWYKGTGDFLIAEPEKALIDCLYLSARKKKQFGYFPELCFSGEFSFKKASDWVEQIPDSKIRFYVTKELECIKASQRRKK